MDLSKSVLAIIAVFVGVLVTATILVPVVGGFTDDEVTVENEGARYSLYELGDTHTITFTADSMITDGVAQPLPDTSVYGSATVVYGVGGVIRVAPNGITWYGSISGQGANRYIGSLESTTITIDAEGRTTAVSGSNERGLNGSIMYPDPKGALALSYNPYVLEDSEIYGAGVTNIEGTYYSLYWSGTSAGVTAEPIPPNSHVLGDSVVNTSNPYTNLLKINSVVIAGDTADADFTYTYFFAPYKVVCDNPNQLDNGTYTALLLILPVLMFVACALLAVRAISGRAD